MQILSSSPLKLRITFVTMVIITVAGLVISAMGTRVAAAQDFSESQKTPYLDDWTHHHLVFSDPCTKEEAARRGKLEQWNKVNDEFRFHLQQGKRTYGVRPVGAGRDGDRDRVAWGRDGDHHHDGGGNPPAGTGNGIVKDWNTPLGSGALGSLTATIATPSSSNISGSSSLAIDGQTFTASAPTSEKETLTFDNTGPTYNEPANGSTVTVGSIIYTFSTFNITTAPGSGCSVFSGGGDHGNVVAANLNDALNVSAGAGNTTYRCATGVTANSAVTSGVATNVVTLTAATAGSTGFTFSTGGATNITLGNTAGTNGTAGANSFTYWSGATYVTAAQLATNIATAVGANATVNAVITATANSPASGDILFTIKSGSGYSATPTNFTAFTGGSFSGTTTATVQPNASPAKWGPSLTTASCALDFVAYPTGQAGATGAANIIAYNNIYTSGCTGTVPATYWAFNTGSGYSVTTSPAVSVDGSKVVFVQSNGIQAQLVVVKWAAGGTLAAPTAPTLATNITTCTAPCMTVTPFGGSHDDTYSSPYYDYSSDDAVYVGDDSGYLQKFTGVLNGASVSVTTTSLGTNKLASPVYDPVSACVFVGDIQGYLYSANSGNTGTVCSIGFSLRGRSLILSDGNPNSGIFDAPIVDSTAQTVYAFVASSAVLPTAVQGTIEFNFGTLSFTTINGSGGVGGSFTAADVGKAISGTDINGGTTISAVSTTGNTSLTLSAASTCGNFAGCGPFSFTIDLASTGSNVVDEFLTSTITQGTLTIGPVGSETIGTGGDGYPLYTGMFDNVYFSSANATGNMYAIGNTGVTTGATLYRIPLASGVMSVPVSAVTGLTPNATNAYPWPSPLTEFCNNGTSACTANAIQTTQGTDYLFFSVNRGNVAGCTNTVGNGCTLSYAITTTSVIESGTGLNKTTPQTTGCWATSGIVLDNSAALTAGAMQIYFVDLNGAAAGGPNGATSANCNATAAPTINAVQTSQSNP